MPLDKQIVPLNISVGPNQKIDPQQLQPGTLTTLTNARYKKSGRIDKRYGHDVVGSVYNNIKVSQQVGGNRYNRGYEILALDTPAELRGFRFKAHATGTLSQIASWSFAVSSPATTDTEMRIQVWSSNVGDTLPNANLVAADRTYETTHDFQRDLSSSTTQSGKVTFNFTGLSVVKDTFYWLVIGKVTTGDVAWGGDQRDDSREPDQRIVESSDTGSTWANVANATLSDGTVARISLSVAIDETLSDSKGLIGSKNDLLLWHSNELLTLDDASDKWVSKGVYHTCETNIKSADESGKVVIFADSVLTSDGLIYYYYETEGTVISNYLLVVDQATGSPVSGPHELNTRVSFFLFKFNDKPYYAQTGVFGHRFGPEFDNYHEESPNSSTRDRISTDSQQGMWFENWKDTRIMSVWLAAGAAKVNYWDEEWKPLTGSYAPLSVAVVAASAPTYFRIIPSSSDDKWFSVSCKLGASEDPQFFIMNEDGTLAVVSTTIPLGASSFGLDDVSYGINGFPLQRFGVDGIQIQVINKNASFTDGFGVQQFHISNAGTITSTVGVGGTPFPITNDLIPVSRYVELDGIVLQVWKRLVENDASYFLCTMVDDRVRVVSQVLFGRTYVKDETVALSERLNLSLNEITSGQYQIALTVRDTGDGTVGVVSAEFDFNSKKLFTGVPYGNSILVAGTNLQNYDGHEIRELGFYHRPRAPTLTSSARISSPTPAGTYSVVVVYEYTDKNGILQRSAPSDTSQIVLATNDLEIDMVLSTYRLSTVDRPTWDESSVIHDSNEISVQNADNVRVVVYRTIAGGTIFYREDHAFRVSATITPDPVDGLNKFEIESISFTTEWNDAQLTVQPILFTDSGEIPATPIGPVKYLTQWNNRIWAAGGDLDEVLFFTKLNQTNLAPEFSELFSINIQDIPGETTGLAGLSDKLILSKRDRLYYTYGEGPDNLGGGGSFALLEAVLATSGAVNGKSIAVNQEGMHYMSGKGGVYTISNGLQVQYTGAMFEDELEGQTILAAVNPIDSDTIRFAFSGGVIEKDTYFNAWTKHTGLVPVDAAIYKNIFHLLASDHKVYGENRTVFKDGALSYGMELETGWISLAGVVGFQRFYRLFIKATYKSVHTLKVSIAYDYGSYIDEVIIDPSTAIDDDKYRFTLYPSTQKCEAFRLKFEEIITDGTSGTHESLQLNFIGVQVGTKRGLPKVKAAQKVGVTTI